jgi:hypothetical protein
MVDEEELFEENDKKKQYRRVYRRGFRNDGSR